MLGKSCCLRHLFSVFEGTIYLRQEACHRRELRRSLKRFYAVVVITMNYFVETCQKEVTADTCSCLFLIWLLCLYFLDESRYWIAWSVSFHFIHILYPLNPFHDCSGIQAFQHTSSKKQGDSLIVFERPAIICCFWSVLSYIQYIVLYVCMIVCIALHSYSNMCRNCIYL